MKKAFINHGNKEDGTTNELSAVEPQPKRLIHIHLRVKLRRDRDYADGHRLKTDFSPRRVRRARRKAKNKKLNHEWTPMATNKNNCNCILEPRKARKDTEENNEKRKRIVKAKRLDHRIAQINTD